MTKEVIVANLEALIVAVEAQPETQFDLTAYHADTECGTMYCTAGLAATMPHFNAQGMRLEFDPSGAATVAVGDSTVADDDAVDPLFGKDSWYNLFSTYGSGNNDEELGAFKDGDRWVPAMTHKELAVARLKAQLEAVKGESDE